MTTQQEINHLQKENESLRKDISQQACYIITLKTEISVLESRVKELQDKNKELLSR